jgi:hypothetical protein
MAICRDLIAQLETTLENRVLFAAERQLIKHLRLRLLGMAGIKKSRARQRSRITWMRQGDANTKFFHLMTNARKKKNFIHSLQTENVIALTQNAKHEAIYQHFLQHTCTYVPRQCYMNFSELRWEPRNLEHLDLPFTEDEIKEVIMAVPKEKAPCPDGYIDRFFSPCWSTIKVDLTNAVQHFYLMNHPGLHLLNQAFVVLIPKK